MNMYEYSVIINEWEICEAKCYIIHRKLVVVFSDCTPMTDLYRIRSKVCGKMIYNYNKYQ